MPEGTEDTEGAKVRSEGKQEFTPEESVAHFKAEAEKAIQRREIALKRAHEAERKLQDAGGILSEDEVNEYRTLKQEREEAEHRKLQEQGEFSKSLEKIAAKHSEELAAEREKATGAETRLRQTLIGLSFAQAPDLFGDTGKTVLTPEIAEAYFGRYVDVDPETNQVIVRDADGDVITDIKTNKPASFSVALGELIDGLPNKDRILRGSGKTGSGSSGGTDTGARTTVSRTELAQRAISGDKSAIKELERTSTRKPSRSIWDQRAG